MASNKGNKGKDNKSGGRNPFGKRQPAARGLYQDEKAADKLAGAFTPSDAGAYSYTDPYANDKSRGIANSLAFLAGVDPITGQPTGTYGGQNAGRLTDILNRMQSGLEGYAAPELQAFREQAQRGIDTSYYTRLRELQSAQARSNVRGASALAQQNNLLRGRTSDQQQLEQDLFIKNADERQRRLRDYAAEVESQRSGQAEGVGKMANWQTLMNASNAATQTANINEKWKQKAFSGANLFGQEALLNAQRNQNWTQRFLEKHPEAYGQGFSSGANGAGAADMLGNLIESYKNSLGMGSTTGNMIPGNNGTTGF